MYIEITQVELNVYRDLERRLSAMDYVDVLNWLMDSNVFPLVRSTDYEFNTVNKRDRGMFSFWIILLYSDINTNISYFRTNEISVWIGPMISSRIKSFDSATTELFFCYLINIYRLFWYLFSIYICMILFFFSHKLSVGRFKINLLVAMRYMRGDKLRIHLWPRYSFPSFPRES